MAERVASESNARETPRRPRRRWRQRLLRALGVLAAALAIGYATLPWWAPKGYLARRFAEDLSRQLGVPVRAGTLELSWRDGVVLSELSIDSEGAFGGGEMAFIERARCPLSPIRLVAGRAPDWLELSGVRVHAVLDEAGRCNLAAFNRVEMPMPARMIVRPAELSVRLPQAEHLLRLDVSDLQYVQGRLQQLGRVTMSAQLAQGSRPAPMTLIASAGGAAPEAAGECTFRFAGVDLSKLPLARLAGLPLDRLEGEGSGRLHCRINAEGMIEDFVTTLSVKGLNAQPASGAKLPVIEEAEVSLSGGYDLYTRSLEISHVRLKLPGMDLSGKADIHDAALRGGWEGVHALDLTGTINPATVASLLSGGADALGGVDIDGDVQMRVQLRGDASRVAASLVLDAGEARVRIDGREAKPRGQALSLELQGSVQRRTWQFSVDQTEFRVGDNQFVGRGALQNVRRVLARWMASEEEATPEMFLNALAALDWRGSWQIRDIDSLRRLSGGGLLDEVRLSGTIDGDWSVEHAGAVLLRARLRLPESTRLEIGRWVVKPAGRPMVVEASCDVATDRPRLSRARVWATVGESSLSVEDGELSFAVEPGPGDGAMLVQAQGRYAVSDLAGVLGCLPAAGAWQDRVAGGLTGRFQMAMDPTARRLRVEANTTQMTARLGRWLAKEPGQASDVTIDLSTDLALPPARRNRLDVRARLGPAEMIAAVSFTPAGSPRPQVACQGRLTILDAEWMLQRTPALAEALGDGRVEGSLDVDFSGSLAPGEGALTLSCDADKLGFSMPGGADGSGPSKARGAPMRLRLAVTADERRVQIDRLSADVGRSNLSLSGTLQRTTGAAATKAGRLWPPPGVGEVNVSFRTRMVPDETLRGLWPAAARQVERFALAGEARADGQIAGSSDGIDLTARYDLGPLGFQLDRRLRKPAGESAAGSIELRLPPDFSEAQLREARLEAPAFRVTATGRFALLDANAGGAFEASVHVPDAGLLARWAPELAAYKLAGGAEADLAVALRDGGATIRSATVRADALSGEINGNRCRLTGPLVFEGVTAPPEGVAISRVRTDALEWSVGDSHGFILADVTDPRGAPSGQIELLASHLDLFELQQWAGKESGRPAPRELTAEETAALADRAAEAIAAARARLMKSDLALSARIGRMRFFDPTVRVFYEVRDVSAEVLVAGGEARLSYRCGFNGGEVASRYGVDLSDRPPEVSIRGEVRKVLTSEGILLQLARDFPGNTVYGTFSRTEEMISPLGELVMNALDGRYRPKSTGSALTVTEDGVVEGRAAPKFVTRFFPGLNLSRYRYRTMTGFATYRADGSVANDMIYDGVNYDVYMEGVTDADHIARYEIGVIVPRLLESPESNHRLRQGRVPSLKFKAEIEGGKFKNQQVSYLWPPETAYVMFVRNNIVYRLLAGGKEEPVSPVPATPPTGAAGRKPKE